MQDHRNKSEAEVAFIKTLLINYEPEIRHNERFISKQELDFQRSEVIEEVLQTGVENGQMKVQIEEQKIEEDKKPENIEISSALQSS